MKYQSHHPIRIDWSSIHQKLCKRIESKYLAGWGFKGKPVAGQRVLGLLLCWLPFSTSSYTKFALACFMLFLAGSQVNAQNSMGVGTTAPNANAVLHLVSPTNNQGFLVPSYTTAERTATAFVQNLSDTDNGLLVFDTDESVFYYWLTDDWALVSAASGDMLQSIYDQDSNGEVDTATVANSLNGYTIETSVPLNAVFTDSQTAADVEVTATGDLLATDVQGALEELQTEILGAGNGDMLQSSYDVDGDGFVDTATVASSLSGFTIESSVPAAADFTDDQAAADVEVTATGDLTSTDVQAALEELQTEILGAGTGDMLQAVYDFNTDGYADTAEVANTLNGFTVETSVPAGATFTDSQTATQVAVTPTGNLTSTDVQGALVELQADIDAGSSGGDMLQSVYDIDGSGVVDAADSLSVSFVDGITLAYSIAANGIEVRDNGISSPKLANGAVTGAKIGVLASEGDAMVYTLGSWQAGQLPFTSISGIPSGLSDGDDVGITSVNTGDIVDGAVTDIKINSVDWSKLSGIPAGIADGDNQTATEVAVTASGNLTATDVQAGLVELQGDIDLATGDIANNASNISTLQSELNDTQTGSGLNPDGTYQANGGANYISGASSLASADDLLDAQVGTNESNIATNTSDISIINSSLANTLLITNNLSELSGTAASARVNLGLGSLATSSTVGSAEITNGSIANVDLDKSNIALSGFGAPTTDVSMGGFNLTALGTPTNSTDAATKSYVDGEITSISLQSAYNVNPSIVTTPGNNFAVSGDAGISLGTNAQNITVSAGAGSALYTVNSSNYTLNGAGDVTATSFTGDGSGLTNLTLPIREMETEGNLSAGVLSGSSLTTGTYNVLYGRATGNSLTTESSNTIIGWLAGNGTTANNNTMVGYRAGVSNTIGIGNTYLGYNTGRFNTTGSFNIAIGTNAGPSSGNGIYNNTIAVGNSAIAIADDAMALGAGAFADASAAVAIGSNVNASTANTIVLGDGQPGSTYNVGVNTNNPSTELDVNGTVTAASFSGDGSGLSNVTASSVLAASVTSSAILDGTIANADLNKAAIPLSGFGAAVADVSMGGNTLTNLASPSVSTDAATRGYVDTQVGAIVPSQWSNSGSDIYYSIGNVGINKVSPAEALDVTGNIQLTGDVKYATAKTKILALTPVDFKALKITGLEDFTTTYNSGAEVGTYSGTPGTSILIGAPVHLPDGAVVTQIDVWGRNTNGGPAEFRFIEKSYSTASTPTVVTSIPGSTSGVTSFSNNTLSITIDNSTDNYLVTFQAYSSQASLTGVKIYYQVTKPD